MEQRIQKPYEYYKLPNDKFQSLFYQFTSYSPLLQKWRVKVAADVGTNHDTTHARVYKEAWKANRANYSCTYC